MERFLNFFKKDKNKSQKANSQIRIYIGRDQTEQYTTIDKENQKNKTVEKLLVELEKKIQKNSRHPMFRMCQTNLTKKGNTQVSKRILNNYEKFFDIQENQNLSKNIVRFSLEDLNDYNIASEENISILLYSSSYRF